eukprot:TRINITY_DN64567_c0_g1_i1.p1 TRINITY_DN64567_c0_g1~~TRINITY_DN64567_c0_g1_i1.p1  ORF type:complete len:492 (-),score=40.94 TRINITY_DN64567_c0_g1_i1:1087-2436(-)
MSKISTTSHSAIDNFFQERHYKEIKEFYLQPIVFAPALSSSRALALLHFAPLTIGSFKIRVDNSMEKIIEPQMASTEKPSNPFTLTDVNIFPPASVDLSYEQYEKLRFFYYFMLHNINHAVPILEEAILTKHCVFGSLFNPVDKFCSALFKDVKVPQQIKEGICHLLVVPIVGLEKEQKIDWRTVDSAIECMQNLLNPHKSSRPLPPAKEIVEGDLLLDLYTRAPNAISKTKLEVKLHTLPEVKEGAVIAAIKNTCEKVDADESKVSCVLAKDCRYATEISWKVYLEYAYVPSILAIIHEKLRLQDLVQANIALFCEEAKDMERGKGKYAKLLEQALTTGSAQRDVNYENLRLLGESIAKLLVGQYVLFQVKNLQLYEAFPGSSEGNLSAERARMLSNKKIAKESRGCGLDKYGVWSGKKKQTLKTRAIIYKQRTFSAWPTRLLSRIVH